MRKNLIFIAIHKETRDRCGELITPASLFKIYEEKNKDCFGEPYIASCEQIYARTNKQLKNRKYYSIDDFKGKKGIEEKFYTKEQLSDYIHELDQDDYMIRRLTEHQTNVLADELFKKYTQYKMSKVEKVLNF